MIQSGTKQSSLSPANLSGSWSALLLLCLILAAQAGCGDSDGKAVRLIRLCDGERIVVMDSDHTSVLDGTGSVFREEEIHALLDRHGKSIPFFVPVELGEAAPEEAAALPGPARSVDGKGLIVPPRTGLAYLVPVKPGSQLSLYVESKASFQAAARCKAVVYQVAALPDLTGSYVPGMLRDVIRDAGNTGHALAPHRDGRSASVIFNLKPETRGLLYLFYTQGEKEALFEEARVAYLQRKHDFLISRQARGILHPAVAQVCELEETVRPSLLLPPRTSITFRSLEMHEGAHFQCSLGVFEVLFKPLKITLTAREENGTEHELFQRVLKPVFQGKKQQKRPVLMGWLEQECDLSRLAGRRVKLNLTCDWIQGSGPPPAQAPLVFCGSPQLHHRDPDFNQTGPNLIILSLDTLRFDHLGCYGYDRPVSPGIDRFASENILFNKVYAHAPHTLASHASLFTSLYPAVHGLQSNLNQMPAGAALMAEILAGHGLATASFNNGSMVSHEFGFHRGFDLYCEVDPIGHWSFDGRPFNMNRLADGSAGSLDRAFSWIEKMGDQRFFLFLHTFMIHEYLPPPDLAEQFNAGCASKLKPGRKGREKIELGYVRDHGISDPDLAFSVNMYDATIAAADRMVEQLLDHLARLGLDENTIVLITSDHGEEFMEHGSVWHMKTVYEELIRVPLMMRVPGFEGGMRVDTCVTQVDLMPTLLELMGIDTQVAMQGRSLVPLMKGGSEKDRLVYAETRMPTKSSRACIIREGWKYIEGSQDGSLKYPAPAPVEIYRLSQDGGELDNVIGAYPKVEKSLGDMMKKLLLDFRVGHDVLHQGEAGTHTISAELMEVLKQQGYL